MANSYRNRFSLLDTHLTEPQKPPPSKVTPDTSDFLLSKTYFKLLQSIHHTEILSEALLKGAPPLGMAKKVAYLTAFIKPAAPDEIVLTEIKKNTINWMNNNLQILQDHYAKLQRELITTLGPFNEEALNRALRWARQRYAKRLTPTSISTLHSVLTRHTSDPPPPATPLLISDNTTFPPLPTRSQITPLHPFKHRNTLILPSRPLPIPSLLSLPPFSLGLTRRFPAISTVTPAPQPPQHNHPPLPQRLPVTRPRPSPAIPPARNTPTDTTPPPPIKHTPVTLLKPSTPDPVITILTSLAPRPNRLSRRRDPARGQHDPLTSPPTSTSPPPSLTEKTTVSIIKPDNINHITKTQPNLLTFCAEIHPCPPSPPSIPLTDGTSILAEEEPSITSPHQTPSPHQTSPPHQTPPSHQTSSPLPSSPPPSPPPLLLPSPSGSSPDDQSRSPSHYQPRLHPYTNRKATIWSLPIRQPVIIMGDSNIARIPKFRLDGIQADSFPGATLRHLTAILLRLTSPRPDIKLIIFSIGINNCLREQTALTIIKDTRRLIRLARQKFPQARIAIPLLTVSIRLSACQLRCVKAFNSFIRDHIEDVDSRSGYLNQLSLLKFQTTHDNIHWTPETARAMLQDWLTQLGL